jgi:hypothetical protein
MQKVLPQLPCLLDDLSDFAAIVMARMDIVA